MEYSVQKEKDEQDRWSVRFIRFGRHPKQQQRWVVLSDVVRAAGKKKDHAVSEVRQFITKQRSKSSHIHKIVNANKWKQVRIENEEEMVVVEVYVAVLALFYLAVTETPTARADDDNDKQPISQTLLGPDSLVGWLLGGVDAFNKCFDAKGDLDAAMFRGNRSELKDLFPVDHPSYVRFIRRSAPSFGTDEASEPTEDQLAANFQLRCDKYVQDELRKAKLPGASDGEDLRKLLNLDPVDHPSGHLASELAHTLAKTVMYQDEAITEFAAKVIEYCLQCRDHAAAKPLLVHFPGPCGVGKTRLATTFAKLSGVVDSPAYIALNGANYAQETSLSKLLGADPGYLRSGDVSELIELKLRIAQQWAARCTPARIPVLFIDEIQKMAGDVANFFHQIADGKVGQTDVPQLIIIVCSNFALDKIEQLVTSSQYWKEAVTCWNDRHSKQFDNPLQPPTEYGRDKVAESCIKAVQRVVSQTFTAETGVRLNRCVCPFLSLSPMAVHDILDETLKRLVESQLFPDAKVANRERLLEGLTCKYIGKRHMGIKFVDDDFTSDAHTLCRQWRAWQNGRIGKTCGCQYKLQYVEKTNVIELEIQYVDPDTNRLASMTYTSSSKLDGNKPLFSNGGGQKQDRDGMDEDNDDDNDESVAATTVTVANNDSDEDDDDDGAAAVAADGTLAATVAARKRKHDNTTRRVGAEPAVTRKPKKTKTVGELIRYDGATYGAALQPFLDGIPFDVANLIERAMYGQC